MAGGNGAQTAAAIAAHRLATEVIDLLGEIRGIGRRQLQLSEAPRKNFLSAGTVAGGGTVGTTPASNVLAANPGRRGLSVQNLSAVGGPNLTVGLGSTAPQSGTGIVLAPGASWDGRISGMTWIGTVSLVGSAAGCAYSWLEAR